MAEDSIYNELRDGLGVLPALVIAVAELNWMCGIV